MNLLKTAIVQFIDDRCSTFAASLAYYTIFALPPLLYLLVLVVTLGMYSTYEQQEAEQRARELVKSHAAQMIGNTAATEEIDRILEHNEKDGGIWWKSLLSMAAIIVSATGVVAAIQDSLNYVWRVEPDPERGGAWTFLAKRVASFAMILGLGFLLLVSLIISTILGAVGDRVEHWIGMPGVVAAVLNYGVQFSVTLVMFAAIFKFMPDAQVHWRDVGIGALTTSLLFVLGQVALHFYLTQANPGERLGSAAASLAVILIWVYYSAMIFLLGAEFTQVYSQQHGRGLLPEPGAVRVVHKLERTAKR